MIGKKQVKKRKDKIVFSKLDCRRIYKIDETISEIDTLQKPKSSDSGTTTVLKKVLGSLTGRKNLIDDKASLHDFMYFYPNRQASIRNLRTDVFSFLST